MFARQADALVAMAQSYVAGGSEKTTSSADHYQVVVHVDESALRDQGGKSDLPIESVRRLSCDSSLVTVTEDERGDPLNVGRKHRVVYPQLKRALLSRDKCCRYPGCTHEKWLDVHHVMHWVDGGETSLANTLMLCTRHHHYCTKRDLPFTRTSKVYGTSDMATERLCRRGWCMSQLCTMRRDGHPVMRLSIRTMYVNRRGPIRYVLSLTEYIRIHM